MRTSPGSDDFRVVQLTPPRLGVLDPVRHRLTTAEPGCLDRLFLIVEDIEAAREDLIRHGADVGEIYEQKPPGVEGPLYSSTRRSRPRGTVAAQEIRPGSRRTWED